MHDAAKCLWHEERLPLIQTNVDNNKNIPDILFSNKRRRLCGNIFQQMDGTLAEYQSQLDTFPIQNAETIYNNVIIPETGYYSNKIRAQNSNYIWVPDIIYT